MTIIFYIILAVVPSILWLFFYLRKDKHPEPNKMIIKIFIWGILAAFGALGLEYLYQLGLKSANLINNLIIYLVGIVFIEEYLKYLVVKIKVLKSSEFDEPIDAMIYMIISALGFAAAENIFLINGLYMLGETMNTIVGVVFLRFLSAVFLHALASGIIGYFISRSLFLKHKRRLFVGLGIIIASGLHGIYDYIIMTSGTQNTNSLMYIVVLLSIMALCVSIGFKSLNKLKSICKR